MSMQEGCKQERTRLFSVVSVDRTRAMGTNWNTGDSFWTSGNMFSTVRMTKNWHKLTRELVESLSSEMLKSCLDVVLGIWLWVTLLEQEHWTKWLLEVPSNLSHSVKWLWRKKLLGGCLIWIKTSWMGVCNVPLQQ